MAIDANSLTATPWKAHLTATRESAGKPAFEQAVKQVIASGVSPTEVKTFLAEHKDVFGDDAQQVARRASEALLNQSGPRLASTPTSTGVKAHTVRFAALPWFQRVTLPQPPILLHGKGDVVVVDGERFSQHDVAALLSAA